jgi:hypothetical protein
MRYTLKDFGTDLLNEVDRGYDVVRIARWAMRLYSDRCRDFDDGVKDAVLEVVGMEDDPQFELTEQELRHFAERLMA